MDGCSKESEWLLLVLVLQGWGVSLQEHVKPGRATAAYLNYIHTIANNPAEVRCTTLMERSWVLGQVGYTFAGIRIILIHTNFNHLAEGAQQPKQGPFDSATAVQLGPAGDTVAGAKAATKSLTPRQTFLGLPGFFFPTSVLVVLSRGIKSPTFCPQSQTTRSVLVHMHPLSLLALSWHILSTVRPQQSAAAVAQMPA